MLDFGVVSFLPNIIIFSNFTKEYLQENKVQPQIEVNANLRQMTEDFDFQLENYKILYHGFVHNINIDVKKPACGGYKLKGIKYGQSVKFSCRLTSILKIGSRE
ncbi:hypothetical protein [Scytonema sp. NUACC26]|uniref:hypothetical protein n=1 Tax=Scytonema sp. NUACC26 TaxID=3140176 RepID=UPI0034DBF0BC